jgi:hypothetical protein
MAMQKENPPEALSYRTGKKLLLCVKQPGRVTKPTLHPP